MEATFPQVVPYLSARTRGVGPPSLAAGAFFPDLVEDTVAELT